MKLPALLALLLATAFVSSAAAVEKIEDFLGVKFGASHSAARKAMADRGSKIKDEKNPDALTFSGGTYAGEQISEGVLQFSDSHFYLATVTIKFSTDKSDEKGLAMYETIRKSLTEKYGPPTTAPANAHGKDFVEKARVSQLETVWQSKDTLRKENRSITLQVPGIGMYGWTFKVTYQDQNVTATQGKNPPRKDI